MSVVYLTFISVRKIKVKRCLETNITCFKIIGLSGVKREAVYSFKVDLR
jgi:hypothetical protein